MRLKTLSVSSYEKRTNHELQNRTTLLAINIVFFIFLPSHRRSPDHASVVLPFSYDGPRLSSLFLIEHCSDN